MVKKGLLLMTAHHKDDPFLNISKIYFTPIQVGKDLSGIDLGINGDNSLDNISSKNKSFCELTAYYWAWKNSDADYIGLMHYRRIFTEKSFFINKIISTLKYWRKNIYYFINCRNPHLHYNNLIKIKTKHEADKVSSSFSNYIISNLATYDVFLPKKITFKCLNLEQQFVIHHNNDDWLLFKDLIEKNIPYLKDYTEPSIKSKSFYVYNMFIMKRSIFDEYMNALFKVLFELEKIVSLNNKTAYQARLFAFLAERFLNIYINYLIDKKNIKIKELNVIFLDLES